MRKMWIIITGLSLIALIARTGASPLQLGLESEEDSEEEETQTVKTTQSPAAAVQNITDQELTNKATLFLTRYFNNHGTEAPLHIPTNLNHTIVITIVPNNGSSTDFLNAAVAATTEVPPSFGGDIPLYQLLQQYQNLPPLQQQHYQNLQASLQQQQQQQQEQQLQNVLQQLQPTYQQPQPALQQQFQPAVQQPQNTQESTLLVQTPIEQPSNFTPDKDLFGFVPEDKLQPQQQANSEVTQAPSQVATSTSPETGVETSTISAVTFTPPPQGGPPPPATTAAAPVQEQPVDNIEDAILEALSIAGGDGGQGGSPSSSQTNQNLLQSGSVTGVNNGNGGGVHVPSNFGSVFIESLDQSTISPGGGSHFQNQNNLAATQPPYVPSPFRPFNPSIILLQHLIPSAGGGGVGGTNNNYNVNGGTGLEQRPIGAHTINAVSGILGSIQQGNLAGVVQNSIKLVDAPAVHNTARLATVAILHNVIQGLNPCNFLGNCAPRQPIKKTLELKT